MFPYGQITIFQMKFVSLLINASFPSTLNFLASESRFKSLREWGLAKVCFLLEYVVKSFERVDLSVIWELIFSLSLPAISMMFPQEQRTGTSKWVILALQFSTWVALSRDSISLSQMFFSARILIISFELLVPSSAEDLQTERFNRSLKRCSFKFALRVSFQALRIFPSPPKVGLKELLFLVCFAAISNQLEV